MSVAVVTGGAGFLGSHLCDYLLERGHSVICLDNLDTGSLQNIEHIRDPKFTFLNQDVTEHIEVEGPVDVIFHAASPASPIDYARLPLHTLKVGSYGTHNALGLAKFKRARILLFSTSEVYGDPQVHPQPETYWGKVNPIGPRGVYDEAKRYAEAMTMAYHRQQGVDTAIARIFNTYGPRMRPYDGRAIPTFVRQALENKPLTVFGDGSQTRSFCYVDDLIKALHLLATSDEHLPVNLGNPGEFTILELAHTVIGVTGSKSEIGVEALRVNLYWGGPTGIARKRPAHAVDPADPAYNWALYDEMVKRSKENGIKVVFSILWTPGWAGRAKNRAPRRMIDLRNFAYAAAKRYSGSFRPAPDAAPLPAVRYWMAWNEPNNPVFLKPQFVRVGRH